MQCQDWADRTEGPPFSCSWYLKLLLSTHDKVSYKIYEITTKQRQAGV